MAFPTNNLFARYEAQLQTGVAHDTQLTSIPDVSGVGVAYNLFLASTAGFYKANQLNGKAAYYLGGSGYYQASSVDYPSLASADGQVTIAAILNSNTPGTSRSWPFGTTQSESTSIFAFTDGSSSGKWGDFLRGANSVGQRYYTTSDDTTWSVVTLVYDGATIKAYLNGTEILSSPATGNQPMNRIRLGSIVNQNYEGFIAGAYIWKTGLDATARANFHSYVQDEFGITVSDYTSGGGGGSNHIKSLSDSATTSDNVNAALNPAIDPGEIVPSTGMVTWYKADALPPAADNSTVTDWPDSGPNGNNASAATSDIRYFNNGINGRPIVRFPDGRNMTTTSPGDLSAFTVFTVSKSTRTTKLPSLITADANGGFTLGSTADANHRMQMGPRGGTIMATANTDTNLTDFFVRTYDYTSGSQNMFLNGTLDGTGTSTVAFTSGAKMTLGTAPTNDYSGDVAEIIVYNRVLSPAERAKVHSYFQGKYGIAVSDYVPPSNAFIHAISGADAGFYNETTPTDTSPFISNRTIRYTPQKDLPAGEYVWRVRGRDPNGRNEWSDWTEPRTLIINNPIDYSTGDTSSVADSIRRKIRIRLDDDVTPYEDDVVHNATRSLFETATSSDLARKNPGKRSADGVSTIDDTVARMLRVLTVDDVVEAIDNATRRTTARKADTTVATDSALRKPGKRAADTVNTADQAIKSLLRSLESIALVSDVVRKASTRPANDTVTAGDALSKEAQPRPADVQGVIDNSYRLIGKVIAEIINTDDETPRKIWVAFKSAVGLTEAVYNAVSGLHADEVTTSEDSHRSTGIGLADASVADDENRKAITQLRTDLAGVGDALRQLYRQYNAEAVQATDDSARRMEQIKTDLVTAVDKSGLTMRLLRTESVSASESIVRSLIKYLADQATPVDMIGKAFTTKTADQAVTTDLVQNTIRLLTSDQVELSDEAIELIRRIASRELVARSERGMVARSDDAIAKQARTVNAQNDTIKARSTR